MSKCKHDYGWLNEKNVSIFLDGLNGFSVNHTSVNHNPKKIKFRCNYPECKAKKNFYVLINVAKEGRVKYDS